MLCPHCHQTIREEDMYVMSQRVPAGEQLPAWARTFGTIGLILIGSLILAYLIHVALPNV